MRKLLLYVRASREDLKMNPEGTLTSQRQRLEEYVKSRNIIEPGWGKIVGVYTDEAKSAKDTNRPQFQEMLRQVEFKKGDTVLVTELSRLSRNMKDFCGIWDFFKAHRTQFLSLRENFDTTKAAGEMMIYSIINFAQFERKQTSERVAANFQARATRGLYNGGYPALGFDSDPEKKGYLTINESEAYQVRKIFQIFREKGSLQPTLEQIKTDGIKTKLRKFQDGSVKGGKDFSLNSLWLVLRNRHYIGEREIHKRYRFFDKEKIPEGKVYQTTQASWPAIVPKDLFNAVQELLDWNLRKYHPGDRRNFDYLYSSLFFCGECGQPLVGSSGKDRKSEKHFYYAHKARKRKSKKSPGCTCSWYSVEAHDIHKVMRGRFKKLAEDPSFVEALFQSADTDRVALIPDNERRLASLEKEVQDANQQVSNLMDTLQNNPSAIVRDLIARELEAKGSLLKAKNDEQNSLRMQTDQKKVDGVERGEFSSLAKNWDKAFAKLTTTERRQFIRTFVGRIEIFPDRLRIRYNYDKRMVARALNILDSAAYQNSFGVGVSAPTPGPFSPKRVQRAWDSDAFRIGRRCLSSDAHPGELTSALSYDDDFIHFSKILQAGIFDEARRLYASGLSLKQVAGRLKKSKTCVRDSLLSGGVTLRPSIHSPEGKKIRKQRHMAGPAPYGFSYLRGQMVMHPLEIEHVLAILESWKMGRSARSIAIHLNESGVPSKKGKLWDHSSVIKVVKLHQKNPDLIASVMNAGGIVSPQNPPQSNTPVDAGSETEIPC